MTCTPCAIVKQLAINLALASDRVANTILGGSPNETLSQRTARAALAGDRAAVVACRVLGWISPGHCAWSLTPGTLARELWAWSPPRAIEEPLPSTGLPPPT